MGINEWAEMAKYSGRRKLHIIAASLLSNPDAQVLENKISDYFFPERKSLGVVRSVEIPVVPKQELWDIDELNKFMDGLFPKIFQGDRQKFEMVRASLPYVDRRYLYLGELVYYNEIADSKTYERKEITLLTHLSDEEKFGLNLQEMYKEGQRHIVESEKESVRLLEQTNVQIYPSFDFAHAFCSGQIEHVYPRKVDAVELDRFGKLAKVK